MRVEKRYLHQNGRIVPIWIVFGDSDEIVKISRKPLDKNGKVCYNKDTKKERN